MIKTPIKGIKTFIKNFIMGESKELDNQVDYRIPNEQRTEATIVGIFRQNVGLYSPPIVLALMVIVTLVYLIVSDSSTSELGKSAKENDQNYPSILSRSTNIETKKKRKAKRKSSTKRKKKSQSHTNSSFEIQSTDSNIV
ncbi:hypothetical protein BLOT_004398 [Blomia tropicalis]|nr:hypothetical protein BLOT_004398 [Blomia tropicalis]